MPRRNRIDPWSDLHAAFDGWTEPLDRPNSGSIEVLTPPTSVAALANGFRPLLHPSVSPK